MQLSSWCDCCGPLRAQCWVIQAGVYHCSTGCRSQRGHWVRYINTGMTLLPSGSPPASHKHITAWTAHTWPASLNTCNTCTHTGLSRMRPEKSFQCDIPAVPDVLLPYDEFYFYGSFGIQRPRHHRQKCLNYNYSVWREITHTVLYLQKKQQQKNNMCTTFGSCGPSSGRSGELLSPAYGFLLRTSTLYFWRCISLMITQSIKYFIESK